VVEVRLAQAILYVIMGYREDDPVFFEASVVVVGC